ncbi:hypothetical protein A4X13_0g8902, partial [Tilletia indica]
MSPSPSRTAEVHPPNSAPKYAEEADFVRCMDQIIHDDLSHNPRAHPASFELGRKHVISSSAQSQSRPYGTLLEGLRGDAVKNPVSTAGSFTPSADAASSPSPVCPLPPSGRSSPLPPTFSLPSISVSSIASHSSSSSPSSSVSASGTESAQTATSSAQSGLTSIGPITAIIPAHSGGLDGPAMRGQAKGDCAGGMASALTSLQRIGAEWIRARGWILRASCGFDKAVPIRSPAQVPIPLPARSTPPSDRLRTLLSSSETRSPAGAPSFTTSVLTSVLRSTPSSRTPPSPHSPSLRPASSTSAASNSPMPRSSSWSALTSPSTSILRLAPTSAYTSSSPSATQPPATSAPTS